MQEKRVESRHHLIHYLRIFDRDNGTEIGNLVNINKGGIMIVSGEPIPEGKALHLRMEFPEEVMGKTGIEFDAESRWLKTDNEYGLLAMGLKSLNISPGDLKVIEYLISFYQDDDEI
ncbi:MAG: PilZ domain-containing protein [Chloroflexota bacterium]